jgi:8-oxo-dGTP pyrophosphatase MutT (NUDIX family)
MKQAVCALIGNKNVVIVVSRKDDPNDFGLPGGKVEGRESPTEAVMRELLEETGLIHSSVKLPKVVFQDKEGAFECITFECYLEEHITQTLGSIEKGVVKWMTWDDLCSQGSFKDYNNKLRKVYEKRS